MNIVLDSNILMSILISKNGKTCQQFESPALNNKLFMHVASIEEIEKHQFKLIKSSKSSTEEFEASKKELFNKVTIVLYSEIPFEIQDVAYLLVYDIDEDDAAFVAASIYLEAILWSGDKPLYKGLKNKGFVNIFDGQDIDSLINT